MDENNFSIKLDKLSKSFGNFKAVDNISFTVKTGEIFGLIGPNGAGKTTTIRMLCGLMDPTSGYGKVLGFDVKYDHEKIKQNIGYMSQKFSLYDDLTIEENLNFFAGIYRVSPKIKEERMAEVIKLTRLDERKNSIVKTLPPGIRQRLALASALMHRPKILFLDEPTAGVDPILRDKFWEIIKELSRNKTTILVTTHYLEEVENCDTIALINNGRVIANGSPKYLKENMMPKKVLEIECDEPIELLDALRRGELAYDATLFGLGVHLEVDDIEKETENITSFLGKKGLTCKAIKKVEPTMEDVFIELISKEEKSEK